MPTDEFECLLAEVKPWRITQAEAEAIVKLPTREEIAEITRRGANPTISFGDPCDYRVVEMCANNPGLHEAVSVSTGKYKDYLVNNSDRAAKRGDFMLIVDIKTQALLAVIPYYDKGARVPGRYRLVPKEIIHAAFGVSKVALRNAWKANNIFDDGTVRRFCFPSIFMTPDLALPVARSGGGIKPPGAVAATPQQSVASEEDVSALFGEWEAAERARIDGLFDAREAVVEAARTGNAPPGPMCGRIGTDENGELSAAPMSFDIDRADADVPDHDVCYALATAAITGKKPAPRRRPATVKFSVVADPAVTETPQSLAPDPSSPMSRASSSSSSSVRRASDGKQPPAKRVVTECAAAPDKKADFDSQCDATPEQIASFVDSLCDRVGIEATPPISRDIAAMVVPTDPDAPISGPVLCAKRFGSVSFDDARCVKILERARDLRDNGDKSTLVDPNQLKAMNMITVLDLLTQKFKPTETGGALVGFVVPMIVTQFLAACPPETWKSMVRSICKILGTEVFLPTTHKMRDLNAQIAVANDRIAELEAALAKRSQEDAEKAAAAEAKAAAEKAAAEKAAAEKAAAEKAAAEKAAAEKAAADKAAAEAKAAADQAQTKAAALALLAEADDEW